MTKPVLIALVGKKGSGKSEVANLLHRNTQGFNRVETLKFAGPLKSMTRALLAHTGMYSDEIERCIEGDLKEAPLEDLGGKSPRHIMQTLGTEWGRECITEDIWLGIMKARIEKATSDLIIIDDCRFINEAALVRQLGGYIVKIHRADQKSDDTHASEAEMAFISDDSTIYNVGTLEDLQDKVKDMLKFCSEIN